MFAILNSALHFILPSWMYQRLIGDWNPEGFKKYFHNTSWMVFAKIISFTISLLTVAYVARYLGPENLGKLSYAQSFVAIFSVIATLGIDEILMRDIVAHPEKEDVLLGTAFISKLFFGTIAITVSIISAFLFENDTILITLIAITSLSLIFQPINILSTFFNAKVQSKYNAHVAIITAFLIPSLKLLIIFLDKGVIFFASLLILEMFVTSMYSIVVYTKFLKQSFHSWKFSMEIFASLISRSWPLLLVSLSGYIYGRIDQIMIQQFIDTTAVGLYDVAVRLTEILGFFPGVLIGSLFPAIVSAHIRDAQEYKKRFTTLIKLCLLISSFLVLATFILSPIIVGILFGAQYQESSSILRIYIWSNIGMVAIVLMQRYFLIENKNMQYLFFSVFGAISNIILNMMLIPTYGMYGAAYATLMTFTLVIIAFIIYKFSKYSN